MVIILHISTKTAIPSIIGSLTYFIFSNPSKNYEFYSQELYLETGFHFKSIIIIFNQLYT